MRLSFSASPPPPPPPPLPSPSPPDPLSFSPQKSMEMIGNNLLRQYERWQPRARYKQLLDPTTDDVRKLCLALRKNAKVMNERHERKDNGSSNGTEREL